VNNALALAYYSGCFTRDKGRLSQGQRVKSRQLGEAPLTTGGAFA
jgi:hypothetical protein